MTALLSPDMDVTRFRGLWSHQVYVHVHVLLWMPERHVRNLEAIRSNLIYIITPQINAKYCVFNGWMILLLITLWKSSSAIPAVAGLAVQTYCREAVVADGCIMKNPFTACRPEGVIADLLVLRGVHNTRTWLTAAKHWLGPFCKKGESTALAQIHAEIIWIPRVQELLQLMECIRWDCAFL